jgi:hypothetical protein
LSYIVVGVNEYYTSQKCPRCQDFIGRITFRRLHCRRCMRRYHRDAMAAANMCNIVRGHLDGHGRPKYLQPTRADGSYPWEDRSSGGGVSSSNAGMAGGSSTASSTASSKRHSPSGGAKSDAKKKSKLNHPTKSRSQADAANASASNTTVTDIQAVAASIRANKRKTSCQEHGQMVKAGPKNKASKSTQGQPSTSKNDHGDRPVPQPAGLAARNSL